MMMDIAMKQLVVGKGIMRCALCFSMKILILEINSIDFCIKIPALGLIISK